jgi:peptidoglycan/xylan/chitin deacetylase (PgdA/CDA1 family)
VVFPSRLPVNRKTCERLSILSQFGHSLIFSLRRSKAQLECGALVTSIDIDVGGKLIGEKNKGKNNLNIHKYLSEARVGEIEEQTIPLLMQFFDHLDIPVTFAVRGQSTETESPVLEALLNSSVEHDIGAHGYYHKTFTSLSKAEAQNELELISQGMRKLGIRPESFVFPKNEVAHLSLLEKFGYKCYRDKGNLTRDGMYVKKVGQLYDVHPSFHMGCTFNPVFLDKMIDVAVKKKLPFHVWFHPRDLFETRGSTERTINQVLFPLYRYAKKKEKCGALKIETMRSITADSK